MPSDTHCVPDNGPGYMPAGTQQSPHDFLDSTDGDDQQSPHDVLDNTDGGTLLTTFYTSYKTSDTTRQAMAVIAKPTLIVVMLVFLSISCDGLYGPLSPYRPLYSYCLVPVQRKPQERPFLPYFTVSPWRLPGH
jgi:hypothetical protein